MIFRADPVPIVHGRYRVRYGAPAVVEISGDPRSCYEIRAVGEVRIGGGSRRSAPNGELLARIVSKGGRRYVGWHGLWDVRAERRCRRDARMVVKVDGDVLRARLWGSSVTRITYTRISDESRHRPRGLGLLGLLRSQRGGKTDRRDP